MSETHAEADTSLQLARHVRAAAREQLAGEKRSADIDRSPSGLPMEFVRTRASQAQQRALHARRSLLAKIATELPGRAADAVRQVVLRQALHARSLGDVNIRQLRIDVEDRAEETGRELREKCEQVPWPRPRGLPTDLLVEDLAVVLSSELQGLAERLADLLRDLGFSHDDAEGAPLLEPSALFKREWLADAAEANQRAYAEANDLHLAEHAIAKREVALHWDY